MYVLAGLEQSSAGPKSSPCTLDGHDRVVFMSTERLPSFCFAHFSLAATQSKRHCRCTARHTIQLLLVLGRLSPILDLILSVGWDVSFILHPYSVNVHRGSLPSDLAPINVSVVCRCLLSFTSVYIRCMKQPCASGEQRRRFPVDIRSSAMIQFDASRYSPQGTMKSRTSSRRIGVQIPLTMVLLILFGISHGAYKEHLSRRTEG